VCFQVIYESLNIVLPTKSSECGIAFRTKSLLLGLPAQWAKIICLLTWGDDLSMVRSLHLLFPLGLHVCALMLWILCQEVAASFCYVMQVC
jgi:hypothetical protein